MAESEPTTEDLLKRIAELEKQLNHKKHPTLSFQVGKKGGVSVYGLGRFPVTLYYEQWMQLLARSDDLRTFLVENKSKLKMRPGSGE